MDDGLTHTVIFLLLLSNVQPKMFRFVLLLRERLPIFRCLVCELQYDKSLDYLLFEKCNVIFAQSKFIGWICLKILSGY